MIGRKKLSLRETLSSLELNLRETRQSASLKRERQQNTKEDVRLTTTHERQSTEALRSAYSSLKAIVEE